MLAFSCLLITPLYFLILFYSEHKSSSQALDPIVKQLGQSISIGDGITLDRINKSILLLPRVESSKVVTANDGYCIVANNDTKEQWNTRIEEPCDRFDSSKSLFHLKRPILNTQNEHIGTVEVIYSAPWDYLLFFPIIVLVSLLLVYYSDRFQEADRRDRDVSGNDPEKRGRGIRIARTAEHLCRTETSEENRNGSLPKHGVEYHGSAGFP
jgi:hypothetical protein